MKNVIYLTIINVLACVNLLADTHYVSKTGTNSTPPYSTWGTAATNLQLAVQEATAGDVILVTNGIYHGNIKVDKPLAIVSVNGPQFTVLSGGGPCITLTNGSSLSGFTVTGGSNTEDVNFPPYGVAGGVYCLSTGVYLTNCVISNNVAWSGGGVSGGTLYNCIVMRNSAQGGGGVYGGILYNCTIVDNGAVAGAGGALSCTLYNCIIYSNRIAMVGFGAPNYNSIPQGGMNYCCTTPLPSPVLGVGNIDNEPLFQNLTNGDLHLLPGARCINAGNNAYVSSAVDLDGKPRIVASAVDIGAYEFQGIHIGLFYAWLSEYGLPADGSVDEIDSDGDGMSNFTEWAAGLNPTNPASVLKLTATFKNPAGFTITWPSNPTRAYYILRSTNLGAQPMFTIIQSNLLGEWQSETTSYTDTNILGPGPYFYRVQLQTDLSQY
jgi:hypothetical protein